MTARYSQVELADLGRAVERLEGWLMSNQERSGNKWEEK